MGRIRFHRYTLFQGSTTSPPALLSLQKSTQTKLLDLSAIGDFCYSRADSDIVAVLDLPHCAIMVN